MASFTVNPQRRDPYKNFRFKVKWGGRYVLGVTKVGALKRTVEAISHETGGDFGPARKSPGKVKYEAITLERGLTHDPEFAQWANKAFAISGGPGALVSLADFRKDLRIELYNEAGQLVAAWNLYRCWVSDFQSMPDLDASGNAVAIETIKIENEGWERDWSVVEPVEPAFDWPSSG